MTPARAFLLACGGSEGACAPATDEHAPLWRQAAELNETALHECRACNDAPLTAMRASYAWKQAGELARATAGYELFLAQYASDETLAILQRGDPRSGTPANGAEYSTRRAFAERALEELATGYLSQFQLAKAARTYGALAANAHLDPGKRRDAAREAMALFGVLDQPSELKAVHAIAAKLSTSPGERAPFDYALADAAYRQWNPNGTDEGANRAVRLRAQTALSDFHATNRANASAAAYALEAIARVARMKRVAGDPSYRDALKATVDAWSFTRSSGLTAAGGTPLAETEPYRTYGADAELTLIDEAIRESFDYDTGHHRYSKTTPEEILGSFDPRTGRFDGKGTYASDRKDAADYSARLDHVIETYRSPVITVAALARQGSLYDSLRTALYYCAGSRFHLFSPQQTTLLLQLPPSGPAPPFLQIHDEWRQQRDSELDRNDEAMIGRYAQAVAFARSTGTPPPEWTLARLASLGDIIGPKFTAYVRNAVDLSDPAGVRTLQYSSEMFLHVRRDGASPPVSVMTLTWPARQWSPLPVPAPPSTP